MNTINRLEQNKTPSVSVQDSYMTQTCHRIRCSLVFQSIRCTRTYRPGLVNLKLGRYTTLTCVMFCRAQLLVNALSAAIHQNCSRAGHCDYRRTLSLSGVVYTHVTNAFTNTCILSGPFFFSEAHLQIINMYFLPSCQIPL